MSRAIGLAFAASIIGVQAGGAAAAPTLCRPDETVIFSCPTGAHTVSICASKTLSRTEGYMQYRYGADGKIDLSYPDLSTRPADAFTVGNLSFSGGGGSWLRFSKGPYVYTIFSAIGNWGTERHPKAEAAGVMVTKDGKAFANFPCRSYEQSDSAFGGDLELGLKGPDEDDPSQDFSFPDGFPFHVLK